MTEEIHRFAIITTVPAIAAHCFADAPGYHPKELEQDWPIVLRPWI